MFRLCLTNGLLSEDRARQVVRRLAESTQRNRFAVLDCFRRLVTVYTARHTASVESAVGLTDDLRTGIEASLAQLCGSGLRTTFAERPSLLAGMRVQVGSDVYDGSLRARLAAVEASL